jgi:pathogenesis-related protein 1
MKILSLRPLLALLPLLLGLGSCAQQPHNRQSPLAPLAPVVPASMPAAPAPTLPAPMVVTTVAQPTATNTHTAQEPAAVQGATAAHNALRAKEADLPDLHWDSTVAAYAERKVAFLAQQNDCRLDHQAGPENPGYGENLAWSSDPNYSAVAAIEAWYSEKSYYDYASNACEDGEVCGHYTQIVWRDSKALGCAVAVCPNGGGIIYGCHYDPPGNWVGEKPY